jgi:uncharacterized membrane protein
MLPSSWFQGTRPEVFGRVMWFIFLVWSTVGMAIMATGFSEAKIQAWNTAPWLISAATTCLRWGDFLFLFFGGCVVLASAWQAMDRRSLVRTVLTIAVGSGIVETIGTLTGFPFGAYTYTGRMGPQLGPLPLAIPVAWWLVVGGFYLTGRRLLPQADARMLSLGTAVAAVVFDWVMEPFAWQVRGYWIWHDGAIPLQNYAAWFALGFILARATPLHRAAPQRLDLRPAGVLILTILLFILGRLGA